MKVTEFKPNEKYKRLSDGKIFKLENKVYFFINNKKKWQETDDIKISDEFVPTHEEPVEHTFMELYNLYKSSDITKRDRFLDRFMVAIARKLDGEENES